MKRNGHLASTLRRLQQEQGRAKPLKPQSEEYRNLEYFLARMSNGMGFDGPSTRK